MTHRLFLSRSLEAAPARSLFSFLASRAGRRLATAAALAASLAACHSAAPRQPTTTPTAPASVTTTPVESLQERVRTLLADPALAPGTWGLQIRSLRSGDTLVDVGAHRLLMPASTMKTVTLAVAADQLGWDYSFETKLVATGPIADGALNGDLVIVGSGDPSLDDWDGTASSVFASWAAQLKALGVRTITGRIIGDDRVVTDSGFGRGWMWDDMAEDYSPPVSGLQFNQGVAKIIVSPGAAPAAPAVMTTWPAFAPLRVVNTVTTGPAGSRTSVSVTASAVSSTFTVAGTIASDSAPVTRFTSVLTPTQYFVNAARTGLMAEGIDVRGQAVDIDDVNDPPAVNESAAIITYRSQPLPVLASTLMQLSQNMYAETLLHTLGRLRGTAGTSDAGRDVVQKVLASWGIPTSELVMADGSGLSRYDLVTPNLLASVLAHVHADARLRADYLSALPVAGKPGMLERRMKGTLAEGNATAKTGSFTNARALAGFVNTRDGEPLVYSLIANQYGIPTANIDRVMDAIVVSLAEFSRTPGPH